MRLDLFSLKLFADIVEMRSIGKGATKSHIAVSAASRRIAALEHMMGTQLLHRRPRGVVTTDAGEILYKGVTETLAQLQRVAAAVSEHARGHNRPVRIYSNLTSLVHYLPEAMKTFAAMHPSVPVVLEERTTVLTLQAVSRGDADIGIVAPIVPYPANLASFRYQVMRHVLVVPAQHPLAELESVTFERATDYDFIGLEDEGGWDQLLRKHAEASGCEYRVRVRVNSFDGVCRLAASGLGVAIVPLATAELYAHSDGLKLVKLDEPWAEMPMDICTLPEPMLTPSVRLVLEHLHEHRMKGSAGVAAGSARHRVGRGFAVPVGSETATRRPFEDSTH
jgi:DNA-binding transcriptional LysR family regulator